VLTPTLSGRDQLSLPHFTPVIIHPVASERPASDRGAAAEAPTPERMTSKLFVLVSTRGIPERIELGFPHQEPHLVLGAPVTDCRVCFLVVVT
jgi:hypothetical protein